jgi:peroxiredoxin
MKNETLIMLCVLCKKALRTLRLNKKITLGDKAPDFSGLDQDGNAHKLADYKGKKSCFLYPKASTQVAQPSL